MPHRSLGLTKCPGDLCLNSFCDELGSANILTTSQVQNCKDDVQPIRAISAGVRQAIIECQGQFRDRKWTCSHDQTANTTSTAELFGSFISQRELIFHS